MASTIEQVVYELLSGDGTLSGLVGTRITPNLVPQGSSMPAVSYTQTSGLREQVMTGPVGLVNSRWQINCWGLSYASVRGVANAVREAIDGYSGSGTGVTVQVIMCLDESDNPAMIAGKDIVRRYGKTLDFEIWFCETP